MKKIIIFLFGFVCVFYSYAQVWEDQLLRTVKEPSINEKIIAFEKYKLENEYVKGNGYKPYARSLEFTAKRISGNNKFPANALFIEWEKERNKYRQASNSNWLPLGPIDVPIILSNGKKRGNGRVNAIAFDPNDEDVIWVGTPAGGLWKTDDGGNTWNTATDQLPVIGVSSIAIDPSNNQIMYISTGDANASDTYSIGLLKSTDGGTTWATTGVSYDVTQGKMINKVIINPRHTDSVFVATNTNMMVSHDGGINWSTVGLIGRWRDIEFMPGNPNVLYAAKQSSGGSNVYKSIDGGVNWSLSANGVASSGKHRPLLAVTADNPNVIYALYSAADYSFHGLYKSIDAGATWTLQSNTPNILGRDTDGNGTGGQSWYDLSFAVSNIDENHLYVGGINLWESLDGGVTWSIEASSGNGSNYSYMHVDQHAAEFNPLNNIAYVGNDGGIYKYMNSLNTWIDISDGLEISQFYKLGLSKSNENKIIAGAQDNGTEMLTNGVWDAIRGADGMECAIDDYDEDVLYSTSQYGGLKKSYDGGISWDNIKPVTYEGGWVTPYKIHPQNNNMIVAGYDEIYMSNTGGAIWDSVSYNISNGQPVRSLALAESNQNYIYSASYSKIMRTKDGGATWANIKPGLPNINISDITVSQFDPEIVWVTFSEYTNNQKVYKSINGGDDWTNVSGNNLPNLPVNCIIHQKNSNEELYIGTDVGVYYKDASMSEWIPYMNGLPNVIVEELEIHYSSGKIRAATFGRGVWESMLNTTPNSVENIEDRKDYSGPVYDLLGRRYENTNLVPKGLLFIEKNKKQIKK